MYWKCFKAICQIEHNLYMLMGINQIKCKLNVVSHRDLAWTQPYYVNDLPATTNFRVQLFADDTILIMTSNDLKTLEKTANDEINKIGKWLLLNKLTLNHSKTNYIYAFFSSKRMWEEFFSSINGQNIHRTAEAKYLGVYLDQKLEWDAHIKHLCKKLSQYCGLFCHLHQNITQKYLLVLYHSLVYPHLIYGSLTWGSTNNSVLHPPQVLQNRLVRIISCVKKNDHIASNSLGYIMN